MPYKFTNLLPAFRPYMKYFVVIILFLSQLNQLCAQSRTDSITVIKRWSTIYVQRGQNLSMGGLLYITKDNPAAFAEMKKAQNRYTLSFLSGCIGGACVGYPVGTALGGGIPNWNIAFAGAAFIGMSIAFEHSFNVHATRGARLHNSSLSGGQNKEPACLHFNVSPVNMCLSYQF